MRVRIDGQQWINCRFVECTIVFGGELDGLVLDGCTFENCGWEFADYASGTLTFLALLYANFGREGEKIVADVFEGIRRQAQSFIAEGVTTQVASEVVAKTS